MKFALVALVATAVAVDAQTLASCPSAVIKPWILSSSGPAAACLAATGFKGNPYSLPTDATKTTFCTSGDCIDMIAAVNAVKPAADCTVKVGTVATPFYAEVIDKFTEACKGIPHGTPIPPTPAPTTAAPTTPPPTTVAPTTPPPTTPTPTTPAVTTVAPTTPPPTTQRPKC